MKVKRVGKSRFIILLALCVFAFSACGGTNSVSSAPTHTPVATQSSSPSAEQPVAPVSSSQASASDIPDTQTFVAYRSSPGNYQLDVPEGWARTTSAANVNFVSNLNSLQVTITKTSTAPTADNVRTNQAVTLQQNGRAVRDVKVQDVQLPDGSAVLIVYTSNSDPNSVTGKQVRLENNGYLFFKNGVLATLTLSAPVGADNVDQWARIAHSFKWV